MQLRVVARRAPFVERHRSAVMIARHVLESQTLHRVRERTYLYTQRQDVSGRAFGCDSSITVE